MRIDFALFASAAILSDKGIFSLLNGGWEWMSAKQFPATCPNLVLLVRLLLERDECDKPHEYVVKVSDPEGNNLSPDTSVRFTPNIRPSPAATRNTFTIHAKYDGFTFRMAGVHKFTIYVDGVLLGEAILEAFLEAQQP